MDLQSEVERLRESPGRLLFIPLVFALAFGVGIGAKEVLDSRSAGAVGFILVLGGFAAYGIARVLPAHPERITPVLVIVGVSCIASMVIAVAAGAPAVAAGWLFAGTAALIYARTRSRAE